jgi:hypothetical protein
MGMVSKLFLLGRPGSGKSTVRRYVTKIAQQQSLSPYPINDDKILRNMCITDVLHTRIRPTEFGGFEVLDFSVLDTALHIIEHRVEKALKKHPLELPRIAIIEFARSDYIQALSQFDLDFLKDAHFLILESNVDTCIDRIERRIRRREFDDDIFVPVNIMEGYYQKDSTPDRVRELQEAFGLNDHQIQLMSADGPCDEFLHDCIRVYFQSLIEPAFQARRFVRTLSTSHTSYTEIFSNRCPSPLQEIQGGEEVNKQLDDTHERQLVGSAPI